MIPRLHVPLPLHADEDLALPPGPAKHVQVLRLQPGSPLVLFNGEGGEWSAEVVAMGRSDVTVRVGSHDAVSRELPVHVTLALGMPANERMDGLIEKACELGVGALQPLVCERSVLKLKDDRAERRVERWQGVASAACEQSGGTRLPTVASIAKLAEFLRGLAPVATNERRFLLSFADDAQPLAERLSGAESLERCLVLSGPEGGLSDAEEEAARRQGFVAVSLGPRVLRADTAPLAMLAAIATIALHRKALTGGR
jgi:16S rRNA (uracil1498-N3)-methyltransferase